MSTPTAEQDPPMRKGLTKAYKEHLRERLRTIEDIVGYLSACHDEGPEVFQLGVKDVIEFARATPPVSADHEKVARWVVNRSINTVSEGDEVERIAERIVQEYKRSLTYMSSDAAEWKLTQMIVSALISPLTTARQGENEYQRGVDAGREEAAGIAESISGEVSHRQIEIAHAIAVKIRARIGKGVEKDGK
jgi:hypothetical protein